MSVVAWLFLIFSGFAAAAGVFQAVFVGLLMPFEPMTPSEAGEVPGFVTFVFNHFLAVVLVMTAFWATTFCFALGLLRRREWGRKGFVVIVIVLCAGTVISTAIQQVMAAQMFNDQAMTDAPADMHTVILVFQVAVAVFGLLSAGALGWVAWRLNSASIRSEFS